MAWEVGETARRMTSGAGFSFGTLVFVASSVHAGLRTFALAAGTIWVGETANSIWAAIQMMTRSMDSMKWHLFLVTTSEPDKAKNGLHFLRTKYTRITILRGLQSTFEQHTAPEQPLHMSSHTPYMFSHTRHMLPHFKFRPTRINEVPHTSLGVPRASNIVTNHLSPHTVYMLSHTPTSRHRPLLL